jgi:hypothetical protein
MKGSDLGAAVSRQLENVYADKYTFTSKHSPWPSGDAGVDDDDDDDEELVELQLGDADLVQAQWSGRTTLKKWIRLTRLRCV